MTLKNRKDSPVAITLNNGRGLHVLAREVFELTPEEFKSESVQIALRQDIFIVLEIN